MWKENHLFSSKPRCQKWNWFNAIAIDGIIVHSIADAPSRRIAWSLQKAKWPKEEDLGNTRQSVGKSRLASVLNWFREWSTDSECRFARKATFTRVSSETFIRRCKCALSFFQSHHLRHKRKPIRRPATALRGALGNELQLWWKFTSELRI